MHDTDARVDCFADKRLNFQGLTVRMVQCVLDVASVKRVARVQLSITARSRLLKLAVVTTERLSRQMVTETVGSYQESIHASR